MKKYLLCFFLAGLIEFSNTANWKYGQEEQWPTKCHEGKRQSPIQLETSQAKKKEFPHWVFKKFNKAPAILKNNGHSVEIRLQDTEPPEISGGVLTEPYIVDHIHFHWESEHIVDNIRFPLEMHMVTYAKAYENLTHALLSKRLAVFAVLFSLSPDDDMHFEPLITLVKEVQGRLNSPTHSINFAIDDLLPRDTAGYFTYDGSLTTPECNEGVTWVVFTNHNPISKHQVHTFEQLRTISNVQLKHNNREIQKTNHRTVFLKVSPIVERSYSTTLSASIVLTTTMATALIH